MAVWEPAPQVEGLEQYMVYPDGCMKFEHEFDQLLHFLRFKPMLLGMLQTSLVFVW
jgi:hypothetical protein